MEDEEEEQEDTELDIPGIADEYPSEANIGSPTDTVAAQDELSAAPQNGAETPNGTKSSPVGSPDQQRSPGGTRTPSIVSETKKETPPRVSSDQTTKPSSVHKEPLEEKLSKSQEEFRKSQDLSLSSKQSSLDQLDPKSKLQKAKGSKMYRRCQRRFRDLIGKRMMKNEELEKQQGDLKQRLNILECSMPAVMVWNIWRMTQGGCVPSLKKVMEKQFQGPAAGEVYCPSTPSRHFDCRVREVEAERKQAQMKVEEARTMWAEKTAILEDRNKKLEEAKKMQEETKAKIQQLAAEAEKLREAASKVEDDGSCETGECGVLECKKKWLEKIPSSASIKSTDIECLDKLQQLAENELYMKRQIADLERREEAYMRTLQQADELWCKLEGDAASTMSGLQEQLDLKTARITELEDVIQQLMGRLSTCRGELEKYMSVSKIEALIGKDDDFADVLEKGMMTEAELREKMIGRDGDLAGVADVGVLSRPELAEAGLGARPDTEDARMGIHPEDFDYEDERLQQARDYMAMIGSLSELDKYGDDYVCDPDFICNDTVLTETGLSEEEMIALKEGRVTARELLERSGMPVEIPESMMRTIPPGEAVAAAAVEAKMEEEFKEEIDVVTDVKEAEVADVKEAEVADVKEAEVADVKEAEVADAEAEVADVKEARESELEISEAAPGEEFRDYEEDTKLIDEDRTYEDERSEDTRPIEEFMAYEDAEPAEEVKAYPPDIPVEDIPQEYTAAEVAQPALAEIKKTPTAEEAVDKSKIEVPRNELLSWQDDVDSIRTTIAKCPDCISEKGKADSLATKMAAYTGTEVKQVIEEPRPRPAATEVQVEVQAKPEVVEAEVTAVPKVAEKEVDVEVTVKPLPTEEIKAEPLAVSEKAEVAAVPEATLTPTKETLPDTVKEPVARMPTIEEAEETEALAPEKELAKDVKKEETPEDVAAGISPEEKELKAEAALVKEEGETEEEAVVEVKVEGAPGEEEVKVKVEVEEEAAVKEKILPEGMVKEEPLDAEEEEEIVVSVDVKEEMPEEAKEAEEEAEIEVAVDVKEEMPEGEEKIEVDVEVLPEGEAEKEIPVGELPEEGEVAVAEITETPKEEEEKIDVDVEVLPEEEGEEVTVEELSEEEEIEPEEEEEEEEEMEIPCTCLLPPPRPAKKIEITQTELTRIETVQVITQTVMDVETQTPPQITRQMQQPKLVTVTRAVDPDSETMQRLLSYGKPAREQATTFTESQMHTTSSFRLTTSEMAGPTSAHPLASILQTLKSEKDGARAPRAAPAEQEIRSIYYGKKPADTQEGKCNCCQCGKTVSSAMPSSRSQMEPQQPHSTFKIPSAPPYRKIGSPGIDQAVQHEALCPECKLKKLQETLKAQDPLRRTSKRFATRDQEVCTCSPRPVKTPLAPMLKKRSDQGCMARIPKNKGGKVSKRVVDKVEVNRDDSQQSVGCACSGMIETPKGMKKVHCACGDPD